MELTLHNGDCLEIMKAIPDKSVDLIICDLPYGCLTNQTGESKGFERPSWEKNKDLIRANRSASACAWDIKIDLDAFWKQVKRIRRSEHSPTIHFCTTKFGYELIKSNPDEFRYDLVWDKQRGVSFLSANKMPMRSHEMIYIFSKAGAFYERKDFTGDFKEHKQYGKAKSDSTYGVVNRKTPVTRPVGTITSTADKRCILSVVKPPQYMKFTPKSQHNGASRQYNQERRDKADSNTVSPPAHMTFEQSGPRTRKEDTSTQYGTKRSKEVIDNTGKRCVLSVVEHPTSAKKGGHPTEKPEALYRFLIERYCPAGGMVLDPTFGSGNSVFTAFAMDRSAIGIEKDETFFKKAEERLNALP